jgi:hypothetical protein
LLQVFENEYCIRTDLAGTLYPPNSGMRLVLFFPIFSRFQNPLILDLDCFIRTRSSQHFEFGAVFSGGLAGTLRENIPDLRPPGNIASQNNDAAGLVNCCAASSR